MFTGLIESLGVIDGVLPEGPGVRLLVRAAEIAADAAIGDSIAVNGCCLTLVSRDGDLLGFEAGSETLSRTNLGRLAKGIAVNLERSLKVGDRLGGHFVGGHVDGLGALDERRDEGSWSFLWF